MPAGLIWTMTVTVDTAEAAEWAEATAAATEVTEAEMTVTVDRVVTDKMTDSLENGIQDRLIPRKLIGRNLFLEMRDLKKNYSLEGTLESILR